ncbi:sensor histidine kinase [Spongiivirga citrea]|uniref:Uncharacterized protein n=1 Tax=Spongiivirga citrea TaxID=1481457 RepID=A0A6M0CPZ6_9FLAO|nr:histidine kinase [Spongiivirga citrea]NER18993.1 hypothetical protein [Spongiivirga citrea]
MIKIVTYYPTHFLLVYVFLCTTFFVNSQEAQISSYPFYDHEGLLLKNFTIIRGSDGFLWSDHSNGLIKHAGNHKVFFPFDSIELESPENIIFLIEINPSTILCNNGRTIFTFNKTTGLYSILYSHPIKKDVFFTDFIKDFQGNVWTTIGGKTLIKISKQGTELNVFDMSQYINISEDKKIIEIESTLHNGNIIFRIGRDYYLFDYNSITHLGNYSSNIGFYHYSSNGTLFPTNETGTYQFENKKYRYTYLPEFNVHHYQAPFIFKDIIEDKQKRYIHFPASNDYPENSFSLLYLNENKKMLSEHYSFNGKVYKPIIDGNEITVASFNKINKIKRKSEVYLTYPFRSRDNQLINNVSCRSIYSKKDGSVIMLTNKGFFELKKGENVFSEIVFRTASPNNVKDIAQYALYGFKKISDSEVLAYGYSNDVYLINLEKNEFKILPVFEESKNAVKIISDIAIKDSISYLLATDQGLFKYDTKNNVTHDLNKINDSTSLNNKYIETLYLDKNNNSLWIGLFNNEGLYKQNLTNGALIHFKNKDPNYPLIDNNVSVIVPDEEEDIVWVGTKKGLQKINFNSYKNQFYDFGEPSTNYITGILQTQNTLWISTYNGLVRFNKEKGIEEVYKLEGGLPDNEFNKKSFYKESDSLLFFGGINGVVSFKPLSHLQQKNTNHISLVEASYYFDNLNETQIKTTGLDKVDEFNIPEAFNYINLKLAYNEGLRKQGARFQYRLISNNQQWTNIGELDELNLAGLSPGRHNLEIRGINEFGTISNYLKYKIRVTQKLYRNPWIVLILSSALLVSFALFYRSRKNNVEQRYKLLKSRSNELGAQMNPHYVYNILNSIQSTLLLDDPKKANKYMVKYSKLVRKSLTLHRKSYASLKEKIDLLRSYLELEYLRLEQNLEYFITLDSTLNIETTFIPSLIIQPIVENAIIHGLTPKTNNRKLWIRFLRKGKHLIIEVEDNGIGRKSAMKKKIKKDPKRNSFGLDIMKERIEILNSISKKKQITYNVIDLYEDNTPKGTKAILRFTLE